MAVGNGDQELVDAVVAAVSKCGGELSLASFFVAHPDLKPLLGDRKLSAFLKTFPETFVLTEAEGTVEARSSWGRGKGLMVRLKEGCAAEECGVESTLTAPTAVGRAALHALERTVLAEMVERGVWGEPVRVTWLSLNYKIRRKLRAVASLAPVRTEAPEGADIGLVLAYHLQLFLCDRPKVFVLSAGEGDTRCRHHQNGCPCSTYAVAATDAGQDRSDKDEELFARLRSLLLGVNPAKGSDLAWLGQDRKVRKLLRCRALLPLLQHHTHFGLAEDDGRWRAHLTDEGRKAARSSASPLPPTEETCSDDGGETTEEPGLDTTPIAVGAGLRAVVKPPGVTTERVLHIVKAERGGDVISISRLDKTTSGVLLYATSLSSEEYMKQQYTEHKVDKTYLALCSGHIDPPDGTIERKLLVSEGPGFRVRVHNKGKPSTTQYTTLARYRLPRALPGLPLSGSVLRTVQDFLPPTSSEKFSLLRVRPLTGRTHQIRVHMASVGHPLVADSKYGKPTAVRRQHEWCPRVFLHSLEVRLVDEAGDAFSATTPLSSDLEAALRHLSPLPYSSSSQD